MTNPNILQSSNIKYPELDHASEMVRVDPRKALEMCDAFSSNNSENWKLHLVRIHACNRLQDWQTTLVNAQNYVKFRPDHHQPYWLGAEAKYRLEMHDEALMDAKKAMVSDGGELLGSWPYRLIAMCHAQKGDLSKALENASSAEGIETQDWFPPVSVFPSGTKSQFRSYLTRLAQQAS